MPRGADPAFAAPVASNANRLFRYLRPHRAAVRRASLYSVLNKLFDIAPELLIGVAVDIVVRRQESFLSTLGIESLSLQLFLLAGLTALIWAGESWFEYLYAVRWRQLAQRVQSDLRIEVYDHVQRLPMSTLESRRAGELQTLLTEDVNQLERFLNGGVNDIIQVVTSTLAVTAVFFVLAPEVAVLSVLPIPIIVGVALWFRKGLSERYLAVRERGGRMGARLTAQLRGIPTLRAYGAESTARAALAEDSEGYVEANGRAIRLASAFVPLVRMAVLSGFVLTLVLGGLRTLDGQLAVGAFSVLVFLTQRLLWPFTRLGETVDLYQRSMASAGRLFDLLALHLEPTGRERAAASGSEAPLVRFRQVGFRYPGANRDAVSEVELDVPPRGFVGVVGFTGSGKSTLVSLLLRFHDPSSGTVEFGGHPSTALDVGALRARIGWVPQDAFVFHGTVRDNIALGRPDASDAEIEAAARSAEIHEVIARLPNGYATEVGEFGAKLSGGERQRLAIARALLKQPELLIFDEATSAVDNETEAAIHRSIRRAAEGRTVLAIAHRLSTVRDADLIVVMKDGRIVERGTHEALASQGGTYAQLLEAS